MSHNLIDIVKSCLSQTAAHLCTTERHTPTILNAVLYDSFEMLLPFSIKEQST